MTRSLHVTSIDFGAGTTRQLLQVELTSKCPVAKKQDHIGPAALAQLAKIISAARLNPLQCDTNQIFTGARGSLHGQRNQAFFYKLFRDVPVGIHMHPCHTLRRLASL